MMVDYDNDGLGDSADMTARVVGMEAMRVVESIARRLADLRKEDAQRSEERAREMSAQYAANAALARRDLAPVLRDEWWEKADLNAIREKYTTAVAFARVDDRFAPVKERIEERARALHDAGPEQILKGTVPPGPQPMMPGQIDWALRNVAPDWYRGWAAESMHTLGKIKDPGDQQALMWEHAKLVQGDLEHWRDHGTLSTHAQEVREAWEAGEARSRDFPKADPSEDWKPLTDEQRHGLGWRPGGPRVLAPLDVDDARLLAATTAPGWYRVQDLVATDVPPAIRERLESRLVEDMTQLRASGRLDTPSAREEWARFSGHPMSAETQDENESLMDFTARREQAFADHWHSTEPERDRVSEPHGEHAGKPMSVPEAEQFAEQYAPFWLRERHAAVLAEAGAHVDPERAAFEQTAIREQYRYAMETARDTGGLGHPYAQALRSQAAMNGVDESEGMRHVPSGERVRFGGPAARPMTGDEALEVMRGFAPEWYRDQVNRTLREDNALGEAAKRVELDAVRADMTQLRDRGVLNTDHAHRLWAAAQPDYDPGHYDSRVAMDRREKLWTETFSEREQPQQLDPNNRERFGGKAEAVTESIPVVPAPQERRQEPAQGAEKGQTAAATDWPTRQPPAPAEDPAVGVEQSGRKRRGPHYDSVARREQEAAQLRAAGMKADAVEAKTVDDYGYPRNPSAPRSGKPEWFDKRREAARPSPGPAPAKGPEKGPGMSR